jgi:hypothetical protein
LYPKYTEWVTSVGSLMRMMMRDECEAEPLVANLVLHAALESVAVELGGLKFPWSLVVL